jgi:hypothetical protein
MPCIHVLILGTVFISCELAIQMPSNMGQSDRPGVASLPVPKWDPSKRVEYVSQLTSWEPGRLLGEIQNGLEHGSLEPV